MTRMRQAYRDAQRLREIVAVFFEAGFFRYIDAARLQYLVPLRKRLRRRMIGAEERRRLLRPVPERVREALERLGPTFVKFGQMLSLRADLVGEDYAREFAKLEEQAPRFSFAEVSKIIQAELGKPLERAFVNFSRTPTAAASLAQVHRASLSGNRKVAVKIQRPEIRGVIERDIHLMFLLAHLLERGVPALVRYRLPAMVKEFAGWTLRELDFTGEAASIDRFRANFADVPEVAIPAVVWTHTAGRVLTMELVSGRPLRLVMSQKGGRAEREKIAEIALRAMFKMYFIDGFFQADPHPGNFVVLPGPRLAILDFGMVGYLTAEMRNELVGCFLSYVNRDVDSYTRHLLALAEDGPEANRNAFGREVRGILDRLMYRPARYKRLAEAFYQVVNLGAAHDFHFPTDLILLARSLLTIEAVALRLAPMIDIDQLVKSFLDSLLAEQFGAGKLLAAARSNVFDYLHFLRALPERTLALLKKLESGEIGVKLNLEELRDLKEEFDRENDIRVISLVAAALFVGSAILLQLKVEHVLWGFPLGHLTLLVSLTLFLWIVFLVMHRPRG